MSYSNFFRLGLSLASEPKDDVDYSPTPAPTPTPPTSRPVTRRRRSSLTLLTSPMSGVKSTIRAASEAVRVVLRSPIRSEFDITQDNENIPPTRTTTVTVTSNGLKKPRRRTASSQVSPLTIHRVPSRDVPQPRFPPPTSPLPPTPLSPTATTDTPDPVLPQTPTLPNHPHPHPPSPKTIVVSTVPYQYRHYPEAYIRMMTDDNDEKQDTVRVHVHLAPSVDQDMKDASE